MKVDLLFPSFIAKDKLLNKNIIDEVYQLKKIDPNGINVSNEGGWHSDDVTHIFKDLVFGIESKCNMILNDFQIGGFSKITSSWVNCNKYKDFNRTHVHPMSFFSGVFYLKVPKNSGNIVFENPNQLANNNFYGLKILSNNLVNSMSYEIQPEENDLIIFNSHLPHFVKPNYSNEDRISIAFNAVIKNEV